MSPFGATRMARGPPRPLANTSTLKPAGTFGAAPSGRCTKRGKLLADGVSNGAGSLSRSILWTTPGASFFQSASPLAGAAAGGGPKPPPPGGRPRGGASLNVPSFTAEEYGTRLSRASFFGTGMTMAEPGTTVVGEFRNLSSVPASQVRPESFIALV